MNWWEKEGKKGMMECHAFSEYVYWLWGNSKCEHSYAWQLQIDGVETAAYVLSSLSLSLSLLPLFIVTILSKPVRLNHQSLPLFTSLLAPLPPLHFPLSFQSITGNLYSTSIHFAQWRLNKCSCQTQTAWSQRWGVTKERVMKRENGRQINGGTSEVAVDENWKGELQVFR